MQQNTANFLRFKLKTTLFATIAVITLIHYPIKALGESRNLVSTNSKETQIRFITAQKTPQKPPDRGGNPPAPEGTGSRARVPQRQVPEGTGSRGDCVYKQNKPPLTSLVGSQNLQLTVDERPKLWLYTPYSREEVPSGEFSLQHGDNEVFRTSFQLPTKPGIFSISLPSTAPALEVGKEYRWYIEVNCPVKGIPSDSSTPASLTGVVQRVNASSAMTRELRAVNTPAERIKVYAKYGVWVTTLTKLAELRIKEPQNANLKKIWIELLSQSEVGLEKISQEPIVENTSSSPEN